MPFPDAGATKWAVSAGGGSEPVWSRAGDEIFYRNLRGRWSWCLALNFFEALRERVSD